MDKQKALDEQQEPYLVHSKRFWWHICNPHKPRHKPMFAKEPPSQRTTTDQMNGETTYRQEGRTANKVLPKAGVTNFYDTFVLNRTLVFQINSGAGTPRLRQYPNRYAQCYDDNYTDKND